MTDLYDPVGGGAVTTTLVGQGPIVGDPELAVQTLPTGYLTTGDLGPGEAGNASGLSEFAVELWFDFDALPTSNKLMIYGPTSGGARQWQMTLTTTGVVAFSVLNNVGVATSINTPGSLSVGTWYHLVGALSGGFLRIFLNGVEVSTSGAFTGPPATSSYGVGTADMALGAGLTGASGTAHFFYADVAFYRAALSATRVAAHYTAGTARGFPQQSVSTRIGAVLDTVRSRAPRQIGTAVRQIVDRYMSGQPPLDALRESVSAEAVDAALFISAGGTLVFLPADHRSSAPYNASKATFGDDPASAELQYTDIKLDYSDSFIANQWDVTREGTATVPGQTQTASDATSIARYFKRPQSLTGVPVVADSDALTIATAYLAKYKDPFTRVVSISPKMADPATAQAVYGLELMDRITVKRRPPGGGAVISQDLYIQRIEHSGSPGVPPSCTLTVSPL